MRDYSIRQKEIIDATISIIYELGYHSLTVKKIAGRLDITDAALYKHFSGKESMISAVIDYFEDESAMVIEKIMDDDSGPVEKVRDFFMDRCRLFKKRPEMTIFMLNDEFLSNGAYAEKISSVVKSHRKLLMGCIRLAQDEGRVIRMEPEHLFLMIMGSLRLIVRMWQSQGRRFDLVKKGAEVWETLRTIMEVR